MSLPINRFAFCKFDREFIDLATGIPWVAGGIDNTVEWPTRDGVRVRPTNWIRATATVATPQELAAVRAKWKEQDRAEREGAKP